MMFYLKAATGAATFNPDIYGGVDVMELKVGDWVETAGVDYPMQIVGMVENYRMDPAPRAMCEWDDGGCVKSRTFKLSMLKKLINRA